MRMEQVRERARSFKVPGIGRMKKAEMIRVIQGQEGNQQCFGADWRFDCQQMGCCWREDCLTKNPG